MTPEFRDQLLAGASREMSFMKDVEEDRCQQATVFLEVLQDRGFDLESLVEIHEATDIPPDFLGRALVRQVVYNIQQTFADKRSSQKAWTFKGLPSGLKAFVEW